MIKMSFHIIQKNSMIPKSFDDLKVIQIWSTDFDNPKVYIDTSILDNQGFLDPFLISL